MPCWISCATLTTPERLIQLLSTAMSGWLGYAMLTGIVFAETGLLVGFVLPGDSLLFTIGVVAGAGQLNLGIIMLLLTCACLLGDWCGYLLGRRAGPAIFKRPDSRFFKQEYLQRTHAFYEKHGGKTIIYAKFVPIIRTFAPFVAGVGKMQYSRFLSFDIFGAIGWVFSMTILGYGLGGIPVGAAELREVRIVGHLRVRVAHDHPGDTREPATQARQPLILFAASDIKTAFRPLQSRMSTSRPMTVLLVEDQLEEEQLLSEVLIEMEENRQWCNWRTASVVHVEQLADALKCLREDRFDVVLLNLTLPDSPALLDSFHEVNDCAGAAPIIILADEDDPNLAYLLLREGAQDVLLKSEMETALFARSLRYAIERQRSVAMLAPSRFDDNLTAAVTRPCFLCLGAHYVQFSRLTRFPLFLASVEFPSLPRDALPIVKRGISCC